MNKAIKTTVVRFYKDDKDLLKLWKKYLKYADVTEQTALMMMIRTKVAPEFYEQPKYQGFSVHGKNKT